LPNNELAICGNRHFKFSLDFHLFLALEYGLTKTNL